MLSPGQHFPEFRLEAAIRHNPTASLELVDDSHFSGGWKLYLFLNRSPETVWMVEFLYLVSLRAQFETRKLEVLGVVMDFGFASGYLKSCREKLTDLPFSMLVDQSGILAKAAGVHVSHRASFLVDPSNKVRYACGTDAAMPRNAFEIFRVLDTLNPPGSPTLHLDNDAKLLASKPS